MIKKMKFIYCSERVSAPGTTLLDILEEMGMSQAELAERTGRPIKTINEIIKGKAAITSETAIQLERVLGASAEFWNQRESNYRDYLARQKEIEYLTKEKEWLKQFPIKEMKKRNWIEQCGDVVAEQIICVLNFFGIATPEQWKQGWTKRRLAFKKAMNLESDLGPISVWLRKGEIEAEKVVCNVFNRESLKASLNKIRELTKEKEPQTFIPQLKSIASNCGVAVIFIQPFPKVPVYGASYWLNSDKAVIQLSLRRKAADSLWFAIFHELGHILKHGKKELFVEIEDKCSEKSLEEKEADEFAAETLIPRSILNQWLVKNPSLSIDNLIKFAQELNVAVGILVGRLQHMGRLKYSEFNDLKFKYDWQDIEGV